MWTVSEYEADPDTALTETDDQIDWLLNSERANSIIRGSDFGTAQEYLDIVHGHAKVPDYVADALASVVAAA